MNRWRTDDFQGSKNTLYGTIMIDTVIHLFKPMEHKTPRVSPDVNCEHWVIMMCCNILL